MTEQDPTTELIGRLDKMAQNGLQEWFELMVKTLPHLLCPPKILNLSDTHAGDGGIGKHIDPLKNSGMELALLDLLDSHQDYVWVLHEIWDIWRGYAWLYCREAHFPLSNRIDQQTGQGLCHQLESNHIKDELLFPEAVIFEGYGKKFFFFHGHQKDWPNDEGWPIGRASVRMADELGIDPMTSPHVTSADRHAAVREMWKRLADDHPDWIFFCGHSHFFEQNGYYNSGSPVTGRLTYFTIEKGEIIPHG